MERNPGVVANAPCVSVIIPHYLGDTISRCLESICRATTCVDFEVIIVDDQPRDDGSLARARVLMPRVVVTKSHLRHGFGAACNAGIAVARGRYVAILNNDVEVTPGWLDALVSAAETDPAIGILQAKIRSMQDRGRFDYSGAAGGMLDSIGFPFALGRVFGEIEADRGQHDRPREIFWAVGAALLIRRSALERTGLFDEAFYMHMEEIDLAWRMQLAGFKVRSCPSSVVYHENGHTLKPASFKKTYLNHRNNLVLLLKNLPLPRLLWILPIRLLLESATAVYGFVHRDWKHPLAAVVAVMWVLAHIRSVLQRRHEARARRHVSDDVVLRRMRPGWVVVDHFVRRLAASDIVRSTAVPSSLRESLPATCPAKPRLGVSLASR